MNPHYYSTNDLVLDTAMRVGAKVISHRQVMSWLNCNSATARGQLAQMARKGMLTVERRKITGWQKAGPGSGKSPISHKVRLEYSIAPHYLLCTPVDAQTAAAMLAAVS